MLYEVITLRSYSRWFFVYALSRTASCFYWATGLRRNGHTVMNVAIPIIVMFALLLLEFPVAFSIVITSYSIHYTKLYDALIRPRVTVLTPEHIDFHLLAFAGRHYRKCRVNLKCLLPASVSADPVRTPVDVITKSG